MKGLKFGKAVAALEKAAGEAAAMVQRNHAANMLECVSKSVNCHSCWGKLLLFLLISFDFPFECWYFFLKKKQFHIGFDFPKINLFSLISQP